MQINDFQKQNQNYFINPLRFIFLQCKNKKNKIQYYNTEQNK